MNKSDIAVGAFCVGFGSFAFGLFYYLVANPQLLPFMFHIVVPAVGISTVGFCVGIIGIAKWKHLGRWSKEN